VNAQERISSAGVNARRKHNDGEDDLPKLKQKQKQKHVMRPPLPKRLPDGDVSPSSRDTRNKKDSSRRCCARIEDDQSTHDVRARSRMRGALTRRVGAC
jgi:hypothetical protein